MKTTTDIRERIAIRAYFAWQNGSIAGHAADWREAELIEKFADDLAVSAAGRATRSAAAKKAAATRKAKAAAKVPAGAVAAARKPVSRRAPAATAH